MLNLINWTSVEIEIEKWHDVVLQDVFSLVGTKSGSRGKLLTYFHQKK